MRQIMDPRMRGAIPDHWPSKCTIKTVQYTITEDNQSIPSGLTPIETLIDIPCRIGPIIRERPTDDEMRTPDITEDYQRRYLKLNRYAPEIDEREMIADVEEIPTHPRESYEIRGVEHDSEMFSTRLRLEILRPING